jgi:hypothetical protein
MQVLTARPGSSQMRLSSKKPQSHKFIPVLSPDAVTDSMPMHYVKLVEPVSFYTSLKYC